MVLSLLPLDNRRDEEYSYIRYVERIHHTLFSTCDYFHTKTKSNLCILYTQGHCRPIFVTENVNRKLVLERSRTLSGGRRDGYSSALGQGRDLLLEQLLSLGPYPGVGSILQLQQAGQQSLAEHLGTLTGKQGWQVVNADDAEGQVLAASWELDRGSRLIKGGDHVVNGNRVVRVRPVGIKN